MSSPTQREGFWQGAAELQPMGFVPGCVWRTPVEIPTSCPHAHVVLKRSPLCISPKSRPGVCRRLLHRISKRNRRHHRLLVTPKIAERSRKTQCLCRAAWLCMRTGSRGPEEEGTLIPSQKDFTASVDLSLSVHLPGGTRSPQHSGVTGCLALWQPTEPCTRTRSKIGCESSAEANSMKGTSKENTNVSPRLGDTGRSW